MGGDTIGTFKLIDIKQTDKAMWLKEKKTNNSTLDTTLKTKDSRLKATQTLQKTYLRSR